MMLKFWTNLTVDLKAVIATVGVFIIGYLVTLAPGWVALVLFSLSMLYAVFMVFRLLFTIQGWAKEDKE